MSGAVTKTVQVGPRQCIAGIVDTNWSPDTCSCYGCEANRLERQLVETGERGVWLWRTLEEWLLLHRIFGGSASEEYIVNLRETLEKVALALPLEHERSDAIPGLCKGTCLSCLALEIRATIEREGI